MASNSGWTFGLPSGQSKVSNTDEEFRSIKGFVERWTEQEHYATGGSANSAGVHRLGSARIYSGPASQLSNPTGDGGNRLFFTTDTERLYVAQASSSSWSLASENVQTTSQNSWSATQEFADIIATDISLTGSFSGITSHFTVLADDVEITSGHTGAAVIFENPGGTRFAAGDFMIASVSSFTGANIKIMTPIHNVGAGSAGSIVIRFVHQNLAGASAGLPSGTTVSVLAFKTGNGAGV